jgi:hypothetical protein
MKYLIIPLFLSILFVSCQTEKKETQTTASKETKTETKVKQNKSVEKFIGSYVSGGYDKRSEGNDWVAVIISKWNDSTALIKVRSRTDKKKATCTFDARASQKDSNTLAVNSDGRGILFRVAGNNLTISGEYPDDESQLSFFCSGGASLSGTYAKLGAPLDKSQFASMSFNKMLMMNDIIFEITSTENDGENTLVIQPAGLKAVNNKFEHKYQGMIYNAEVADLNIDGYPEVFIYTVSPDKSRKSSLVAYSVNNGKSISSISFPELKDNAEASKGYRGNDEFAVVEATLVQRFPVYEDNAGENAVPKKMRQLQYKLKDGEASRVLYVDKVVEFPINE